MSTELWQRAKQVFEEALDKPPRERQEYVQTACGTDTDLHAAVQDLLAADLSGEDLLPQTAVEEMSTALQEEPDQPWLGRSLGAYKIISKLGQGGMGRVFLAERADDEFRKKVAIKVLSLWLTAPETLRRFRLERQILAMLEHPNIARLLDGGTTDEGLPYLVMEYVEGEPLTTWCDKQQLSLEERLKIFRQVCEAVSYAHQNLVVHRDLKPHNILITEDGTPKLLDFGIAKILEASSPEADLGLTHTHQRLMTPDYASPEQITGRPITTATDVYSLGVLLYELLTGNRPFARQGRSLEEIERTANTREPPLPSGTVARRMEKGEESSATQPEVIAQNRGTKPQALVRQLAGDLDNIVLKTLRAKPTDRYGSAKELSDDLHRFLHGHPVEARAAGRLYHLSRFVQRHKAASALVVTIAFLIVAFGAVTWWQSLRILKERDLARIEQARAEQIARLLISSFELADPSKTRGGQVTAREILQTGARQVSRELADQPELQATMLHTIGKVHSRLGLYDQARSLLEGSMTTRIELLGDEDLAVAESRHEWSDLLLNQGELDEAEKAARHALETRRREGSPDTAESLHLLAEIRRNQGQREEAVHLHEEALELQRIQVGEEDPSFVHGTTRLARSLRLHGNRKQAEALYRQALTTQEALDREDHPLTASILRELSRLHQARGDLTTAQSLSLRALEMNRRLYGEEHPTVSSSLSALANVERRLGNPQAAESHYRASLEIQRKLLGPENPLLAGPAHNLALVLHRDLRQFQAAELLYREAIEVFQKGVGAEHVNMGFFLLGLGGVLSDQGRTEEAQPVLSNALDLFTRLSRGGADGRNAAMVKSELGGVYLLQGKAAKAEPLLASSLPILAKGLGKEHEVTGRCRERLARLYRQTGRSSQADALEATAEGSQGVAPG